MKSAKTVQFELGYQFHHHIHNLRSTYAVSVFRALLKHYSPDEALSYVSERLGHTEFKTTLKYLKIAQDEPTGDEIYEDILDFIGAFEESDKTIFGEKINTKVVD